MFDPKPFHLLMPILQYWMGIGHVMAIMHKPRHTVFIHNHLSLPFDKFLMILAQLRHMPLAERSGKTTIEN
jgi:hypothetical protein